MPHSTEGKVLLVGRKGDPKMFEVSPEAIDKIPGKFRKQAEETYRSGGLGFYKPEALHEHANDRKEHLVFSLSMIDTLEYLPAEVLANFNFPRSEGHPQGILQTA